MSFLLLAAAAGVIMVAAVRNNAKIHNALKKHTKTSHFLPQAISMLVISAQVSELIKVVEHVTLLNVVAAVFLLAILAATRSGTESELH